MEGVEKDKHKIKIVDLLKSHPEGLTISDIMKKLDLARHTVLARLHHLVGKGDIDVRQINMAKVHYFKGQEEKKQDLHPMLQKIELNPLKAEHIQQFPRKEIKKDETEEEEIKARVEEAIKKGSDYYEAQVIEQREPINYILEKSSHEPEIKAGDYIKTGISGLDQLLVQGIPRGSSVLVAGGAGSGKTILCLEILKYHATHGEKCLYMSFEESEEHLIKHMEGFGWNPQKHIEEGSLLIKRFNPFDITRSVDALLMAAKGELLIEVEPIIFPKDFRPDIIVVDSLTAIASAFTGKEDSYRVYIEQLFRLFEKIKTTSFLITETKQIPTVFSQSGVEEFLADGVIVLYNIKRGNVREGAIEILKLRGAKHQKKIVAMQITDSGIIVYPEQEIFGSVEKEE